jgi:PEP-CTERM motif
MKTLLSILCFAGLLGASPMRQQANSERHEIPAELSGMVCHSVWEAPAPRIRPIPLPGVFVGVSRDPGGSERRNVPEPGTLFLVAAGLGLITLTRWPNRHRTLSRIRPKHL